jgi:itaconate CoA-transferase
VFTGLLERADVVVSNLGPGALGRLGLAPETLAERYPQLIVVDISGYSDRRRRDRPLRLLQRAGRPVPAGTDRPGRRHPGGDARCGGRADGIRPQPGAARRGGARTRRDGITDGRALRRLSDRQTAVLGTTSDREWQRLARDLLGRPDLAEDLRYAHNQDRVRHRAQLDQVLQDWCAPRDLAKIQRRADAAGIGNARLNGVRDLAGHEQLAARGRWRQVDSPVGPVPALLPPALARGWPTVTGQVPALGADTDAIRAEVSRPRDPSR